jgi:hypothetical protein
MPRPDLFVDDVRNLAVYEVRGNQLVFSMPKRDDDDLYHEDGRSSSVQTRREVERLHEALGDWRGQR